MHPLFPILDGIHKKLSQNERSLSILGNKIESIQAETSKVIEIQKELKDLVKQSEKKGYKIEQEGFDVIVIQ